MLMYYCWYKQKKNKKNTLDDVTGTLHITSFLPSHPIYIQLIIYYIILVSCYIRRPADRLNSLRRSSAI